MSTRPCVVPGCTRPARSSRQDLCEAHYYRLRRTGEVGNTPIEERSAQLEAFTWLVEAIADPSDTCIEWPFPPTRQGYGRLYNPDGERIPAHRLALILATGPPPFPEAVTRHIACSNRLCVNPLHLVWGTQADNVADSIADGSFARGERGGGAKLTDAQRDEIVRERIRGIPNSVLAQRFDVSPPTITRVTKTWNLS